MGYVKAENYSNPIPPSVLEKKDFAFPSGGGGGGTTNNFSFYNGVVFVNEFHNANLSGDIIPADLEWIVNFALPQEVVDAGRKIMAFGKLIGSFTGNNLSPNFKMNYKIAVNNLEYTVGLVSPFNDFRIVIPATTFLNNQITITLSKNGTGDNCFVSSQAWVSVCII